MRGVARHFVPVALVLAVAACNPAALAPEEIVPAFIAASQDAARTMHMEWQGTLDRPLTEPRPDPDVDPSQMSVTISGTFDFNGSDYAGALGTSFAGTGQSDTSYARVGGVVFIDFGGSGWQRADDFGQQPVELDPFHGLDERGVAYEAAETVDGRALHRLRVLDPLAALGGGIFSNGISGGGTPTLAPDGVSDFVIYVDAQGIPVSARVALDLLMPANVTDNVDAGPAYQVRFDYQFSLWGEPVTISPPTVVGGGGFDDMPQPKPR